MNEFHILTHRIDSEVIQIRHSHLLSLAKDVKLIFTLSPPGIEPRTVAWQSINLPLPLYKDLHHVK